MPTISPVVLRERDELHGRHEPPFGMLPADERFGSHDGARVDRHDGLVVQHELSPAQTSLEIGAHRHPFLDPLLHGRRVVAEPPAALSLRLVHREVGVDEELLHHLRGGLLPHPARCGPQRDPDAGVREELDVTDDDGLREDLDDALRRMLAVVLDVQLLHEDAELVAAQPRHRVVGPKDSLQPLPATSMSTRVSDRVTVGVVDVLEVVEVGKQQAEGVPTADGPIERMGRDDLRTAHGSAAP